MSATRDKTQSVAFVYSNIYQIYKKAKTANQETPALNSRVIRADELTGKVDEELSPLKIKKFEPQKLQSQGGASNFSATPPAQTPFDELKTNINRLQDLHSKLRFMLQELEDLVKERK